VFKRFLPTALLSYFFVVVLSLGCTKLDTTSLGSDLIPAVDNIHTFGDTLDIITTQGTFTDSFKIFRSENHALGYISNDPIFGKTEANVFLQPKPGFYPFYFGSAGDTLVGVDSVVLCLSYKGSWGDTNPIQKLDVYKITDDFFGNDVYTLKSISYQPTLGPLVSTGTSSVDIRRLPDLIKFAHGKDSVSNQIRIKLSDAYRDALFYSDTLPTSPTGINAFRNDSLFRKYFSGLAVKVSSSSNGNALMYVNLTDANTRLEVHFRKKNFGSGKLDTVYNSLLIATADSSVSYSKIYPSGTSNYIKRTYTGTPTPSELYLQTGPGTYANLEIPAFATLTNRIIHRAQISIEQIPSDPVMDSIFSVPPYLYLDLIDTGASKWKPLYYDLNPGTRYDPDNLTGYPYFPINGTIDYPYFGFAHKKINAVGQNVWAYDLNITRYLQQLVTDHKPNYHMRLFPGFGVVYPQYGTAAYPSQTILLNNPLGFGRIKVKSGSYPDPDKKVKMRVVIISSKI
jgi:hypothetical protein